MALLVSGGHATTIAILILVFLSLSLSLSLSLDTAARELAPALGEMGPLLTTDEGKLILMAWV